MRHSDEVDELFAAMAAAQGEFGPVPKNKTNPFFGSTYADLADVVQVGAPILSKHGLMVIQLPEYAGMDKVDTLTTLIGHSSGQWVEASMRLVPTKEDPQAHGSATTYARRQSYTGGTGLVADDDDDGAAGSAPRTNGHATSAPMTANTEEAVATDF